MNKLLYILCLGFMTAQLQAGPEGQAPITIKGVISDSEGAVMENVEISLERNGQVLQTIFTNEEGKFEMRFSGEFIRTDQLRVKIYKKGYKTQVYKPLAGKDPELAVKLEKRVELRPMLLPSSRGNYNII